MDALEFLRERKRMCSSYESCCGCPLSGAKCLIKDVTSDEDCKAIIATVDQWSKEHPRKTRQSVFLEQWPSAKIDEDIGVPNICPADLDERYRDARGRCNIRSTQTGTCDRCRQEFWSKEVE